MRITVVFQFTDDPKPAAVTGVEDHVTDLLMPTVGDLVHHVAATGEPFSGRVIQRAFAYNLPMGVDVSGDVTVTLFLERMTMN